VDKQGELRADGRKRPPVDRTSYAGPRKHAPRQGVPVEPENAKGRGLMRTLRTAQEASGQANGRSVERGSEDAAPCGTGGHGR
jgi:hypothetical protein